MNEANLRADATLTDQPLLPVRRLHNYFYCPRLFYLQWVENLFQESAATVAGTHVHRNVDEPSDAEKLEAVAVGEGARARSIHLTSETLGLTGVADLVESDGQSATLLDYKRGSASVGEDGAASAKENDTAQCMALALLLREHGILITKACVYYAADRRRVEVPLTAELEAKCRAAIAGAKAVATGGIMPQPLTDDVRCLHCSAYPICLPGESKFWSDNAPETPTIKEPPRPERDEGEVLIVQTPGAYVGCREGQFTVALNSKTVRTLPVEQVRAIYLYGAIQISTQAMHSCLDRDIAVALFAPSGRFKGLLQGLPVSGVDARLGQYRMFVHSAMRLGIARPMIRAKIHNQRVMLMRNGNAPTTDINELERLRDAANDAIDLIRLLGIEGQAAAIYFRNFASMLKDAVGFDFEKRNRHPPRDPVNALLSMGYSMLCKELAGVCHAVGLDPFLGVMHQPRYGRPALALDLMEEFRPLIADSVAVSLINRGELDAEDFEFTTAGTFLKEGGRRAFWEAYMRRMDTDVSHPAFGYKMAYRRMLEVQCRLLWRVVRGEAVEYVGFTTR